MKKIFSITLFIILSIANSWGQDDYRSLKDEINANLDSLVSYDYMYNNHSDLYPDSLSLETREQLIRLLSTDYIDHFDINDFPNLEEHLPSDGEVKFRTLTFSFDCGGRMGLIPSTIIIIDERNANKKKIHNLKDVECRLTDIYHLKDNLFILLGDAPGWNFCHYGVAFAMQFEGNDFTLDYPAFDNIPILMICNVSLNFNHQAQVLSVEPYAGFKEFPEEYESLFTLELSEDDEWGVWSSKFDGEKFIKN